MSSRMTANFHCLDKRRSHSEWWVMLSLCKHIFLLFHRRKWVIQVWNYKRWVNFEWTIYLTNTYVAFKINACVHTKVLIPQVSGFGRSVLASLILFRLLLVRLVLYYVSHYHQHAFITSAFFQVWQHSRWCRFILWILICTRWTFTLHYPSARLSVTASKMIHLAINHYHVQSCQASTLMQRKTATFVCCLDTTTVTLWQKKGSRKRKRREREQHCLQWMMVLRRWAGEVLDMSSSYMYMHFIWIFFTATICLH